MQTLKLIAQIALAIFLGYVLISTALKANKFKWTYYDVNVNFIAIVILTVWLIVAGSFSELNLFD